MVLAFVLFDVVYVVVWSPGLAFAFDAHSYWGFDFAHLYDLARIDGLIGEGAFRYTPVIAQAMAPLSLLSWPAFVALWTALQAGAAVLMGGRRWWLVLLFPATLLELWAGNVHLLMAAVVVFGFRWPGLWAFMVLTKISPFVGVLWFAFRAEWRKLGIALATTAVIVAVSYVMLPSLWMEWFALIREHSQLPSAGWFGPLIPRVVIAVALLAWAARTNRRWVLPIVVVLALPNIWLHGLSILAASIALYGRDREVSTDAQPAASLRSSATASS
jgi:hypothetical protein